jgi:hypothetical protein
VTAWISGILHIKNIFVNINKQINIIPIFAIISCLIVILLLLILNLYNFLILCLYFIIPLILSSAVYLYFNDNTKLSYSKCDQKSYFKIAVSIFYCLLTTAILILWTNNQRNNLFYIILTFIGLIIFLKIIYFELTKIRIGVIISEVCILSLLLIWGVTLNYPLYVGSTDILVHIYYVKEILKNGFVTANFGIYMDFPLWHILNGEILLAMGGEFSVSQCLFITSGILYSSIILIIYKLCKILTNNSMISLFSTLLLCFSTGFLVYGMYAVSRSIELVFFANVFMLIFIIYSKFSHRNSQKYSALILFFITILILFHPASMPFIIIILLITWVIQGMYLKDNKTKLISNNIIIFTIVTTLAYWIYRSQQMIELFVRETTSLSFEMTSFTNKTYFNPYFELFNYLQYSCALFVIFIGIYSSFKLNNNDIRMRIIAILSIFLMPLSFPGPLLIIEKFMNVNLLRFELFSVVIFAIVGAVGLKKIIEVFHNKKHIIIIIFLFILILSSISNDFVSSDNPIIKRQFYTNNLEDSEILAMEWGTMVSTSSVYSDYVGTRYILSSSNQSRANIIQFNTASNSFIVNDEDDLILLRQGEMNKRSLQLLINDDGEYISNPSWENNLNYVDPYNIKMNIYSYNSIYSDMTVNILVN